jgi:hypothetical protein
MKATRMLLLPQQRLLSEAVRHGTEEVLRWMPAENSPELEQAIRHGARQAVLYYAAGLDTLSPEQPSANREKLPV